MAYYIELSRDGENWTRYHSFSDSYVAWHEAKIIAGIMNAPCYRVVSETVKG